MKNAAGAVAGALTALFAPAFAPAGVCTVMVLLDFITAWLLGKRLAAKGQGDGRLSSHRFGKVLKTLVRIYTALGAAALAQRFLIADYPTDFNMVRAVAGAVCFRQLLSILENESTCSDARWAGYARRFLADKARRHLEDL